MKEISSDLVEGLTGIELKSRANGIEGMIGCSWWRSSPDLIGVWGEGAGLCWRRRDGDANTIPSPYPSRIFQVRGSPYPISIWPRNCPPLGSRTRWGPALAGIFAIPRWRWLGGEVEAIGKW
ncbi:unnamed protein product [Prunus armeniaca]|uniref:Uncharacterized protein n=1 Tax=Prunus armeniaca TaxID=36596 RepID=A0A6J5UPI3_PRUAR|nr:unnamed protein product [Prunus armeniaca]